MSRSLWAPHCEVCVPVPPADGPLRRGCPRAADGCCPVAPGRGTWVGRAPRSLPARDPLTKAQLQLGRDLKGSSRQQQQESRFAPAEASVSH